MPARGALSLPQTPGWRVGFVTGAARGSEEGYFLAGIKRWIYAGDTALHLAATAYRVEAVCALLTAGADVSAPNRHGQTPLRSAAAGIPGSDYWSAEHQGATIAALVEAGADPNAVGMTGG
ncbi:MAG TPA: hypothetical protein VGL22_16215 [Terracidiphilus sp.]